MYMKYEMNNYYYLGMCFYLGQNIDVISCICNVLVIGFCVDYCVHIAHAYLVSYGDR